MDVFSEGIKGSLALLLAYNLHQMGGVEVNFSVANVITMSLATVILPYSYNQSLHIDIALLVWHYKNKSLYSE